MAEVINDIEALQEFRAHLVRFNLDLAESFAAIRGHWRELGDVWRDEMTNCSAKRWRRSLRASSFT